MKEIKLPFVTLTVYDNNIVESVVHEGVELTQEMLQTAADAVRQVAKLKSAAVLSNRLHSHSYDYEGLAFLPQIPELVAYAVLSHRELSQKVAKTQEARVFSPKKPFRVFTDRGEALAWLEEQLSHHRQMDLQGTP